MFLSFVVPVYNTEKYLPECLDSLLEQDIPKEEYEIICVNDGSTDNSLEILHAYQKKCPNIVVIDKENGGVATARNTGMDAAKGDYIWFVDSDDFIRANIMKELRKTIIDADCDRLSIGFFTFAISMSPEEQALMKSNCLQVNSHYNDSVVCGSLFRKKFILTNQCRFNYTDITHGEDTLFMYEFMSRSPKCEKMDVPFYFYRNRPDSAMTSNSMRDCERKLYSYLSAAIIMKGHYEKGSSIPCDAANLLMTFLWLSLHNITKLPFLKGMEGLQKLKKEELYPYSRPKECTLIKSYQTTRTDFIGKLFDRIYINMHRPWGFWTMFLLQRVINAKHRIANAG
ncbi:MAG: glycosyltransferase family 2 protein [Faecousia sp.]